MGNNQTKQTKRRGGKVLKWILLAVVACLVVCVLYLCLHTPEHMGKSWTARSTENTLMTQAKGVGELKYIDISPYKNPETTIYRDGYLYSSVEGGIIIRCREDGSELTEVLSTGGCILGFNIADNGTIYICEPEYNGVAALLAARPENSYALEIVSTGTEAEPFVYPDALCLSADGNTAYVSDACKVKTVDYASLPMHAYYVDMMGRTETGRVYRVDIQTGETKLLTYGYAFANGIGLSSGGDYLLLNENLTGDLWAIDTNIENVPKGEAGTRVLHQGLPGYIDNMSSAVDGNYWIGVPSSVSDVYEKMFDKPVMRKLMLNLPDAVRSGILDAAAKPVTQFIKCDQNGNVVEYYYDDSTDYGMTTGACETDSRIYVEHLNGSNALAYFEK